MKDSRADDRPEEASHPSDISHHEGFKGGPDVQYAHCGNQFHQQAVNRTGNPGKGAADDQIDGLGLLQD